MVGLISMEWENKALFGWLVHSGVWRKVRVEVEAMGCLGVVGSAFGVEGGRRRRV